MDTPSGDQASMDNDATEAMPEWLRAILNRHGERPGPLASGPLASGSTAVDLTEDGEDDISSVLNDLATESTGLQAGRLASSVDWGVASEPETPASDELDDFLANFEEPTLDTPEAQSSAIPSTTSTKDESTPDIPTPEPPTGMPNEVVDEPDWLSELAASADEPEAVSDTTSDGPSPWDSQEIPDWLRDSNIMQSSNDGESDTQDLPSWDDVANEFEAQRSPDTQRADAATDSIDDDVPDWLTQFTDADSEATGTTTPEQTVDEVADDVPDWLAEFASAGVADAAQPQEPPQEESSSEPVQTETNGDIPDWLSEFDTTPDTDAQPADAVTSDATEAEDDDWLANLTFDETNQAPSDEAEGAGLDWLEGAIGTGAGAIATGIGDAGDEASTDIDDDDWLQEISGLYDIPAEPVDAPSALSEEDTSDWLSELGEVDPATIAETVPEEDTPDWLSELSMTDAGSPDLEAPEVPEVDVSGSIEDVLGAITEARPEVELPDASEIDLPDAPEVEVEADLPDWLSNFEADTPSVEVPDVEVPEIELPDIEAPNLELPEVELPDTPEIDLPDVDVSGSIEDVLGAITEARPEVELPDAPEIDLPDAPEVEADLPDWLSNLEADAPSVEVSEVELPEVELPEVELPDIESPEVELPDVEVPDVDVSGSIEDVLGAVTEAILEPDLPDAPEVEVEADLPDWLSNLEADAPSAEAPDVELPEVELPEVELPDIESPEVELPDIEVPDVDVSGSIEDVLGAVTEAIPEPDLPDAPEVEVEADLPDWLSNLEADASSVELPDVELPEVDVSGSMEDVLGAVTEATPEPDLPDAPEVEVEADLPDWLSNLEADAPSVEVPDVEAPDVELPEVELPEVEPPNIEAPEVELPDVDVSGSIEDVLGAVAEATPEPELPDVPEIDLPDAPEVEVEADLPDWLSNFEADDAPSVEVPDVDLPEIELPDLDAPSLELADVEVPDVELPAIEAQEAELSDVEVPDWLEDIDSKDSASIIEPEPTVDSEKSIGVTDWLNQLTSSDKPDDAPDIAETDLQTSDVDDDTDVPDWFSGIMENEVPDSVTEPADPLAGLDLMTDEDTSVPLPDVTLPESELPSEGDSPSLDVTPVEETLSEETSAKSDDLAEAGSGDVVTDEAASVASMLDSDAKGDIEQLANDAETIVETDVAKSDWLENLDMPTLDDESTPSDAESTHADTSESVAALTPDVDTAVPDWLNEAIEAEDAEMPTTAVEISEAQGAEIEVPISDASAETVTPEIEATADIETSDVVLTDNITNLETPQITTEDTTSTEDEDAVTSEADITDEDSFGTLDELFADTEAEVISPISEETIASTESDTAITEDLPDWLPIPDSENVAIDALAETDDALDTDLSSDTASDVDEVADDASTILDKLEAEVSSLQSVEPVEAETSEALEISSTEQVVADAPIPATSNEIAEEVSDTDAPTGLNWLDELEAEAATVTTVGLPTWITGEPEVEAPTEPPELADEPEALIEPEEVITSFIPDEAVDAAIPENDLTEDSITDDVPNLGTETVDTVTESASDTPDWMASLGIDLDEEETVENTIESTSVVEAAIESDVSEIEAPSDDADNIAEVADWMAEFESGTPPASETVSPATEAPDAPTDDLDEILPEFDEAVASLPSWLDGLDEEVVGTSELEDPGSPVPDWLSRLQTEVEEQDTQESPASSASVEQPDSEIVQDPGAGQFSPEGDLPDWLEAHLTSDSSTLEDTDTAAADTEQPVEDDALAWISSLDPHAEPTTPDASMDLDADNSLPWDTSWIDDITAAADSPEADTSLEASDDTDDDDTDNDDDDGSPLAGLFSSSGDVTASPFLSDEADTNAEDDEADHPDQDNITLQAEATPVESQSALAVDIAEVVELEPAIDIVEPISFVEADDIVVSPETETDTLETDVANQSILDAPAQVSDWPTASKPTEGRHLWIKRLLKPGFGLGFILLLAIPLFFHYDQDGLQFPWLEASSTEQQDIRNRLQGVLGENLPGSIALVSFDYTPATAGEMDPLAIEVVRKMLGQGMRIIAISLEPEGVAMAQQVFDLVAADQYGEDVLNLGYRAGGMMAVRQMSFDAPLANAVDFVSGQPYDQLAGWPAINQLNDIALVVNLSATPDTSRWWVEQLDRTSSPSMLAVVSAAAEPFILPYVASGQYKAVIAGVNGAAALESARVRPQLGLASSMLDSQSLAHLIIMFLMLLGTISGLFSQYRQEAI